MASYYNDPTISVSMTEESSREFGIPLVYPSDLSQNGETKAVSFYAVNYKKNTIGRQEKSSNVLSRIYLPVPPELSTGDALNYEEFSAPLLQNVVNTLTNIYDANMQGVLANGVSAAANVVDKVFGQDAKYAQSLAGQTVNPRNTNLFKAPKAREYQFAYKLVAKNYDESKIINEIIKRFRYHSYPDVNTGEGIFLVPDIFLIDIKRYNPLTMGWEDNEYMFKPLPCALVAMNVQFNGDSPVAFYKGSGAPVEVLLTLNFVEMELDNKKQLSERYYDNTDVVKNFTTQQPTEETPMKVVEQNASGIQTLNRPRQLTTAGSYTRNETFPRLGK